ncbi:MAG: nuclear transport factor 2 family protein [Pleurocapsa sp. MO_192.B19]|nr:nuclear transport factor 2 family protein [Pleurocapsa sp. MO_192.B19]
MNPNTDPIKRERTVQVVSDFFNLLETMNIEQWIDLWTEDGVHHMPYAPSGFPNRVEGKTAIYRHFNVLPKTIKRMAFVDRKIYPMLNSDQVFAEYRGEVEIADTGRPYNNNYCGLFQLRENRLVSVTEYFNPLVFIEAFGDTLQKV